MSAAASHGRLIALFACLCASSSACGLDGEGAATGADEPASVRAEGNRPVDAAKTASSKRSGDVVPTTILPRTEMPLKEAERACGMTRADDGTEASPVYLEIENTVPAHERAVGCLREARSQYFAGEAVSLALKLIDDRPCAALGLIHSGMEADLSKSRVGLESARSWARANAPRFTRVSSGQLEALAGKAAGCSPSAPERAEAARAALTETALLLRTGNLINIDRESES